MAGVKGRSGGHNKSTRRDMELKGVAKHRLGTSSPPSVIPVIDKIDGLGEIGTKVFEHYMPMLLNNGTMGQTDSMAFHKLCRAWEEWYLKDKERQEKGDYIDIYGKDGRVLDTKTSPWFKQCLELGDRLDAQLAKFGLNPRDRGNIERISNGEDDSEIGGLT